MFRRLSLWKTIVSSVAAVADPPAVASCKHCGNPFKPVAERPEFCCAGCEYVHRLITGQSLDRFYQLRDRTTSPVRSVVFQNRDHRWLEGLVDRAEKSGEATLDLDLQGISCVGCVWLIDRIFRDWPGAIEARINATLGRMTLRWRKGGCDVVGFAKELQRFGYVVGPASKSPRSESGALVLRIGLCAAFALNGMLFSLPAYLGMEPDFPFAGLFTVLSFVFASLSVGFGGTYFFSRSWRSIKRGVLHIDLPISLGILVGYLGSIYAWSQAHGSFVYFDFVSVFTFLMLVGRWTQLAAVEKNRNRLLGLRQDPPPVELVQEEEGSHRSVATKAVAALDRGDLFVVEPGQIIPVSSILHGLAASVGLDWINGESDARAVVPGQLLESGAINLSPHKLRCEAVEPWVGSMLHRLLNVQPSSEVRNRLLEKIIRWYLLAVIAVAIGGGVFWFLSTGDIDLAVQVVVSVLVVSCPCAIGVTLPLIDELATARLRDAGVFVRSDTLWSRLKRVAKVIFDKTGTLTLESLELKSPGGLKKLNLRELGALWNLVRHSRHPVASCLREAMLSSGLVRQENDKLPAAREEVGFGLEWIDTRGVNWRLGRREWVCHEEAGANEVQADVWFGRDGQRVAEFSMVEAVREDAAMEVARMKTMNLEVFILSGDRSEKVERMAHQLGIPGRAVASRMTPGGKAEWVRNLDRGDTLMIGDGANDSLAFAAAHCRGTPAIDRGLLEHQSDFFFLGRGLAGVSRLFGMLHSRQRAIVSVLGFTTAYNVFVVAIALAGLMNPLLAAVLMPASAVISLGLAGVCMRRA